MDSRTGTLYESSEVARAAGVPEDEIITLFGTREQAEDVSKALTAFREAEHRDRGSRLHEAAIENEAKALRAAWREAERRRR